MFCGADRTRTCNFINQNNVCIPRCIPNHHYPVEENWWEVHFYFTTAPYFVAAAGVEPAICGLWAPNDLCLCCYTRRIRFTLPRYKNSFHVLSSTYFMFCRHREVTAFWPKTNKTNTTAFHAAPVGIEPTTNRLTVYCSTTELQSQLIMYWCAITPKYSRQSYRKLGS